MPILAVLLPVCICGAPIVSDFAVLVAREVRVSELGGNLESEGPHPPGYPQVMK